jgi:hypothetical protein
MDLLETAAANAPLSVGFDIDLSPEIGEGETKYLVEADHKDTAHRYTDPFTGKKYFFQNDSSFFEAILKISGEHNKTPPVYLAASRTAGSVQGAWLGSPNYNELAAWPDVVPDFLPEIPERLTLSHGGKEAPALRSFSSLMSEAAHKESGVNHLFFEDERESRIRPGWTVSLFLPDVSRLDSIRGSRIDYRDFLKQRGAPARGKLVLVGYAPVDLEKAPDHVNMPGIDQDVPGIMVHALGIQTRVSGGCAAIRHVWVLLLDFVIAYAIYFGSHSLARRYTRKHRDEIWTERWQELEIKEREERLRWLFAAIVFVLVCGLAVFQGVFMPGLMWFLFCVILLASKIETGIAYCLAFRHETSTHREDANAMNPLTGLLLTATLGVSRPEPPEQITRAVAIIDSIKGSCSIRRQGVKQPMTQYAAGNLILPGDTLLVENAKVMILWLDGRKTGRCELLPRQAETAVTFPVQFRTVPLAKDTLATYRRLVMLAATMAGSTEVVVPRNNDAIYPDYFYMRWVPASGHATLSLLDGTREIKEIGQLDMSSSELPPAMRSKLIALLRAQQHATKDRSLTLRLIKDENDSAVVIVPIELKSKDAERKLKQEMDSLVCQAAPHASTFVRSMLLSTKQCWSGSLKTLQDAFINTGGRSLPFAETIRQMYLGLGARSLGDEFVRKHKAPGLTLGAVNAPDDASRS